MGGWMDGWMDGRMDGWLDGRAGLMIADDNQNLMITLRFIPLGWQYLKIYSIN